MKVKLADYLVVETDNIFAYMTADDEDGQDCFSIILNDGTKIDIDCVDFEDANACFTELNEHFGVL